MKKIYSIVTGILLTASVWSQAPQKMSYQAVIRNSSNALVTSTKVGMRISILKGSATATASSLTDYVETQTDTTNANGLVSLEIGKGTPVIGTFAGIKWAEGPYFIKTETDPKGGTNYTIIGTNELLSVPYALQAKTAENFKGTITETDPVYIGSQAANIQASDITKLSNLSGTNTGDQDLSGLATTSSITSDLATKVDKESGKGLSSNDYTTNEKNKLAAITGTNTGDQDLSGLATTSSIAKKVDIETDKDLQVDGTVTGQMQYWIGSSWVTISPGTRGQTLTFCDGIPTWGECPYPVGRVHCYNTAAVVPVTNPNTGKIWMDRNLGASRVALSSDDFYSYGDLYQWGRGADGHQCRNSATITSLSSTDVPGNANFITINSGNNDWRSPQNTNLWQGVNGVNNPCPTGYRIPTDSELEAERLTWSANNSVGAFESPLKLPLAGLRSNSDGLYYNTSVQGWYWSSSVGSNSSINFSRLLYFQYGKNDAVVGSLGRASGYSVRCIKD
jgi:hypothetical protein